MPISYNTIIMEQYGGPEVLRWRRVNSEEPGPGEVFIKHHAVGLNFIDTYHRTGLYPLPELPATPGMEGAGVVEAVGGGVTEFKPGDRVAYANPPGSYAEYRIIPADKLVPIPEGVSFEQAAAMMLKGMTARYLLHGCFPVKAGDTILMHAAAGGVGSIVCQWASHLGATVIGTVGSKEKAEYAAARGCKYPILYREEDFVARVKELTNGRGVDVVYDAVGQAVFLPSLDCIRRLGTMVTFGNASGAVEPFSVGLLAQKGSLFLTRPTLMSYVYEREDLLAHARDLFDVVRKGVVRIEINQRYPLSETPQAHKDLQARKTTGSTILLP